MAIVKLNTRVDFIVAQANIDMAIAALTSDWSGIATVDQDTWAAATIYGADDLDGYKMFMAYFMGAFITNYDNVTKYLTTTLGAGTDNTYANRATRIWSTT